MINKRKLFCLLLIIVIFFSYALLSSQRSSDHSGRLIGSREPEMRLDLARKEAHHDSDPGVGQEDSSVPQKDYLLFVEISEQLSANTLAFLQLSYFSILWHLRMVTPVIDTYTTHLSSLPSLGSIEGLPFFDVYNQCKVEEMLTECFAPNLPSELKSPFTFYSLNDVLVDSPKEILILRFVNEEWLRMSDIEECFNVFDATYVEITLNHLRNSVHSDDRAKNNGTFRVWKSVCIKAIPGVPFSMRNVTEYVQTLRREKLQHTGSGVSVVILSWRKLKNEPNPYYYYDPLFNFDTKYCKERALPHSPLVPVAADKMMKDLNIGGSFIGVYARTEHLALSNMDTPGFLDKCFGHFQKVFNQSLIDHRLPVFLVHDNSQYGSKSLQNPKHAKLMTMSLEMLRKLQLIGLQFAQFTPDPLLGYPLHRGFVAAVEQEFLSQSYQLLTLGGGGFMMNVKERFLERHSSDKLHTLCL